MHLCGSLGEQAQKRAPELLHDWMQLYQSAQQDVSHQSVFVCDATGKALMPQSRAGADELIQRGKAVVQQHHALPLIHLRKHIDNPSFRPLVLYVFPHTYTTELIVVAEGAKTCRVLLSLTVDFGMPLPETDDNYAGAGDSRSREDCYLTAVLIGDVVRTLQMYMPISHAAILDPVARMRRSVELWLPNAEREQRYLYALLEQLSRCKLLFYWQTNPDGTTPRGAALDATLTHWLVNKSSDVPNFIVCHREWPHTPFIDGAVELSADQPGKRHAQQNVSARLNIGTPCRIRHYSDVIDGIVYEHCDDHSMILLTPSIAEPTFVVWRQTIVPPHIPVHVLTEEAVVFFRPLNE